MISFVPNTIQKTEPRELPGDQQRHLLDPPFRTRTRNDFTQSLNLNFSSRNAQPEKEKNFLNTIQVAPRPGGSYQVYKPSDSVTPITENGESPGIEAIDDSWLRSVEVSGKEYGHNLNNPDLWRSRFREKSQTPILDSRRFGGSLREQSPLRVDVLERNQHSNNRHLSGNVRRRILPSSSEEEPQCQCKLYHCHTFSDAETKPAILRLLSSSETPSPKSHDILAYNSNHYNIANSFWRPSLSMQQYKHGDPLVTFSSLWPRDLTSLLRDGMNNTALRHAISDLCRLGLVCGPVQLLRSLIELCLIRVDHQFESGAGLLHLACLVRNSEAVHYLIHVGVSTSVKDKQGRTAEQVCFDPVIRKQVPAKYQLFRDRKDSPKFQSHSLSMKERDEVFHLAENPKFLEELQLKLQTMNFNVNTEYNSEGDYLIHIACRKGLCQLALITTLIKLQRADINLCNTVGLSPLMLAAEDGDNILCEVLICLFGANPNLTSEQTGKCALHYAVEGNHINTINCLIKRGADVSIEDYNGCRPDDIPFLNSSMEDCREIIKLHRDQRTRWLCEKTIEDKLEPRDVRETDMFVTNGSGLTLLMLAAKHNRVENLEVCLQTSIKSINAQHKVSSHATWDGKTALCMAAEEGYSEVVRLLLKFGANPVIGDMAGHSPLQYAILNNHEQTVETFLDFFPTTYKGLHKALRLCKRTPIYTKVKQAWERRQEEIVTPELLGCAMEGKAEELYCLLEDGDNINSKSGVGNWPMYLAVENGHLEVIKLLHEKGADVRKRHLPTGSTVLHIAAKMGHLEIVQYLLDFCHAHILVSKDKSKARSKVRSLDINAINAERKTALQLAAEKGFIKIVKLLMRYGATVALLDSRGSLITCPEFVGVRAEIESHREKHTQLIMKLITDKTKKSMQILLHHWLPKFDHNLRERAGDTPLMVACKCGKPEVVKFLLDSAVYPELTEEDSSDSVSDADSGVLDITTGKLFSLITCITCEEFSSQSAPSCSSQRYRDLKFVMNSQDTAYSVGTKRVQALLKDVDKPKGLYIYHDGLVSHVCAVNPFDGCTPLHRALEGGDNSQVVYVLLFSDASCINTQNTDGLTPLHLACKLGRKKSLEKLLMVEGIDLNLLTLDAKLPEEMTTNRSIVKMVQKARRGQPVRPRPSAPKSVESSMTQSLPDTSPTFSTTGSTINFDKLQHRYQALREDNQNDPTSSTPEFEYKLK
ncbi:hypothetical protein ScPMuIL_016760 [Solemya velum]